MRNGTVCSDFRALSLIEWCWTLGAAGESCCRSRCYSGIREGGARIVRVILPSMYTMSGRRLYIFELCRPAIRYSDGKNTCKRSLITFNGLPLSL